jgi:beta-glucosidase
MSNTAPERAQSLLKTLSVSEKIGQLCQLPANQVDAEKWIKTRQPGSLLHLTRDETRSLQSLALKTGKGIPLLFGIDAIHGHAFDRDACVFPTQLALSASWNPALIEEIGKITAKEVASTGMHWTFSPVLCLARDTRWGRVDETFGEDPLLAGILAAALIKGLQGEDLSAAESVIACAKHYLAHGETQGGRDSSESDVSMRKLLTYFYPPFKQAVQAGCGSFMTAYQAIDGVPCTARGDLLKDLLKNEEQFNAFIVTDWNNVERMVNEQFVFPDLTSASAAAVESGNDMIMSTPGFYDAAHQALEEGSLSVEAINQACLHILTAKYRCGLFDQPFPQDEIDISTDDRDSFRKKAFEAACESITLLENNGILPLSSSAGKIALIGPAADDFIGQLGDWSFGPEMNHASDVTDMHKDQTVTIRRGLESRLQGKAELLYHPGCHMTDESDQSIDSALNVAKQADTIVLAVGDTIHLNGEFRDRATLDLPGAQKTLVREILKTGKPVILVIQSGKPLEITEFQPSCAAVIATFNSGVEGGNALAAILFGDIAPSGRLTISWPRFVGQLPVFYNQIPGWHNDKYADMSAEPLYPFGFGLGYTDFEFSKLRIKGKQFSADDTIHGSIEVRNRGKSSGETVVQVYTRDVVSSVTTPVLELKWFKKIFIEAGKQESVAFSIPVSSLALVNSRLERVVEPGEFIIFAGCDSRSCKEHSQTIIIH